MEPVPVPVVLRGVDRRVHVGELEVALHLTRDLTHALVGESPLEEILQVRIVLHPVEPTTVLAMRASGIVRLVLGVGPLGVGNLREPCSHILLVGGVGTHLLFHELDERLEEVLIGRESNPEGAFCSRSATHHDRLMNETEVFAEFV